MSDHSPDSPTPDSSPSDSPHAPDPMNFTWIDGERQEWLVELGPERIALRRGDEAIEIPRESWHRDVYVAKHGEGLIVRVERFERSVGFVLDQEAAKHFLMLFDSVEPHGPPPETAPEQQPESTRDERVLWPKVSPLAVWALGLSSLTFIPVAGILPAIGAVILLIFHRSKVRPSRAWDHSRVLARWALVLIVVGLGVSALALWGIANFGSAGEVERAFQGTTREGRNWAVIAAAIFVVLASLTVHEAAHAITAWWLGDGLARSQGRVTLNPLAHIDPFGTVLLPLILVWTGNPVFGYARPVPVRLESLPRYRRAHILISLAGPGSNLLMAAVSLMLLVTVGCLLRIFAPEATATNLTSLMSCFSETVEVSGFPLAAAVGTLCTILKLSFVVNVLLAMFNLIPIPPLDGSWVLEHLFPRTLGPIYARIRPYGLFIFIGLIYYTDLFRYLAVPLFAILQRGMSLVHAATGF